MKPCNTWKESESALEIQPSTVYNAPPLQTNIIYSILQATASKSILLNWSGKEVVKLKHLQSSYESRTGKVGTSLMFWHPVQWSSLKSDLWQAKFSNFSSVLHLTIWLRKAKKLQKATQYRIKLYETTVKISLFLFVSNNCRRDMDCRREKQACFFP